MGKLPKIFVNKIDKPIKHSLRETLISEEKINEIDLDNIFNNNTYSFNHRYKIILNDNKIVKSSIIQKDNNTILTIDGDKIRISNIKSISEIKK